MPRMSNYYNLSLLWLICVIIIYGFCYVDAFPRLPRGLSILRRNAVVQREGDAIIGNTASSYQTQYAITTHEMLPDIDQIHIQFFVIIFLARSFEFQIHEII